MYKRIFTIVIDSVGVGELPDAAKYGDVGSNTIAHTALNRGLNIPNMEKLGIGHLTTIEGVSSSNDTIGYYGRAGELSNGKDTLTGHWELMGLEVKKPFQVFTDTGFPQDLIETLEEASGRKVVGNYSASGTEIIKDLGEQHMKEGNIIVYTSADSVLQIAANEAIVPIEELWDICKKARKLMMKDEWMVARIIARPFVGDSAETFERTSNRHDYAVDPYGKTVLDTLKDNNYDVYAIGKINDIFNNNGITEYVYTTSNYNGMEKTIEALDKDFNGLCFTNLVDFDAKFGHRRNPDGYAMALEEFDAQLGTVLENLREDDLLVITADHGNDPIHEGTDHTREYVPILMYSKAMKESAKLDDSDSFAVVGATIADNFKVDLPVIGKSVLNKLK
jgi:phosphopentomutase